ncbi:MAG TPA: hypothetical protein VFX70_20510 [Mycobacteriales bacterium]|nr:hypothetical protein [Mycobacteriales bacterium]
MNIRELRDALSAVVGGAAVPTELPADDMYPFTFVSRTFVPPFMDALVRVEVCDADPDGSTRARLVALAGLAERVFTDGDEQTVDPLAVRLVFDRLVRRPRLLEAAWPHLGPQTRAIAGKFLTLQEGCRQREEAATAGLAAPTEPGPVPGPMPGLVHSTDGPAGAPCP